MGSLHVQGAPVDHGSSVEMTRLVVGRCAAGGSAETRPETPALPFWPRLVPWAPLGSPARAGGVLGGPRTTLAALPTFVIAAFPSRWKIRQQCHTIDRNGAIGYYFACKRSWYEHQLRTTGGRQGVPKVWFDGGLYPTPRTDDHSSPPRINWKRSDLPAGTGAATAG